MGDDCDEQLKYKQLFHAVREDDEDGFVEVCGDGDVATLDINSMDGTGNTALHIAASTPSPRVLEYILAYPGCDVDPINRIERATPLHLAARIADLDLRLHVVESLLEAGADIKIKDKRGSLAIDFVPLTDTATRNAIRQGEGVQSLQRSDVVHDSDDEPGSDSVPSDED